MKWFHQEISSSNNPSLKHVLLLLTYFAIEGITDIVEMRRRIASSIHPGLIDPEYETWRSKQLLDRLFHQDYIKREYDAHGNTTLVITKQGIRKALTYNLSSMKLDKPKRWDKKWRVVIFDIPNSHKRTRDVFRLRLVQLGLVKLQESVYVSPYPCFDEVEFLRELYEVSFTVRYLLVEKIEDDTHLLIHFHLQ